MKGYDFILLCLDLFMLLVLVAIAVIDFRTRLIKQKLLLLILASSIVVVIRSQEASIIGSAGAMLLIFLVLGAVYFVSCKSIGWGDVKLCTCTAAYLGLERAFEMLIFSVLFCGLFAMIFAIATKASKGMEVPFAPFVALGTAAAFLL